jgi:predicted sulfurtransferase
MPEYCTNGVRCHLVSDLCERLGLAQTAQIAGQRLTCCLQVRESAPERKFREEKWASAYLGY